MEIQEHKNLQDYHTFGVPWTSKYYGVAAHCDDIRDGIMFARKNQLKTMVLGGGSNILPTKPFEGLVIHNQIMGREIVDHDDEHVVLRIGSGENWHELVGWSVASEYYGLENLALIPGTVGGAVVQNIGAYDVNIARFVQSVEAINLKTGEERFFNTEECEFEYRNTMFKKNQGAWMVTYVILKLSRVYNPVITYQALEDALKGTSSTYTVKQVMDAVVRVRQSKLPNWHEVGTAGSFFASPRLSDTQLKKLKEIRSDVVVFNNYNTGERTVPAGWLTQRTTSYREELREEFIYSKHNLVFVNNLKGQENIPQDYGLQILRATTLMQKAVEQDFGIALQPEVLII